LHMFVFKFLSPFMLLIRTKTTILYISLFMRQRNAQNSKLSKNQGWGSP
jgi:hypothetical protein